jgi:hypothetical protein
MAAPHFHRLNAQIAVDRAKVMVRTYVDTRTGLRGRFAFYGTKKKAALYQYAKTHHGSLKFPKPKYRGTFGNDLLNQDVYRRLKDDTLNDTLDKYECKDKPKPPNPQEIIKEHNIKLIRIHWDKPLKEQAEILNLSTRTVDNYRQHVKRVDAEKLENFKLEKQLNSTNDEPAS